MKPEQKSLRIGAAVILFALLLRFLASGMVDTGFLASPKFSSIMLYLGTGRIYRPQSLPQSPDTPLSPEVTAPPKAEDPVPPPVQAVFGESDALLVSLNNYPGYDLDIASLLTQPLNWNLTGPEPTVLIYHSHASESYENTENYSQSDPYRTQDNRYNMLSIGTHLKSCLEAKGITVLHDTTVYDYPSYDDAYILSRKSVEAYLEEYPSICLVLDIHRDAYEDGNGNQARNTVTINGTSSSRLMILTGSNSTGQGHTGWKTNLSTALKLQTTLEKLYPGLCRPVTIRSSTFNQDMSPGALLIEVGTAGDTRQDALNAATLLAEGIAALAYGSQ